MENKPVYFVGDVDIHNLENYKKYMEKVKPLVEKFGGVYLTRGGPMDEIETNLWKPTRMVLVKFPNKESALNWMNSEEYKPIKKIRQENSSGTFVLLEGI
tara:strand:- start:432 stop:731 length:300 start_codon:yes stop_codon:yes gene_type:complete